MNPIDCKLAPRLVHINDPVMGDCLIWQRPDGLLIPDPVTEDHIHLHDIYELDRDAWLNAIQQLTDHIYGGDECL